MSQINYRPDIDGLRAIAILCVVIYHAFPSRFQGGFVGVDIFFVISGYLISTIIYIEIEKKSFSYRNFYSRRIRRIFPALLLVLVTTLLFGWLVLYADEFKQLGKHIIGGLTFVSNFVLLSETGYFDRASETKPLLHLWSLGIEEQFYIFWPIIVLIAWKKKVDFLILSVLIAYISFFISQMPTSLEALFYHPIYRFWELMIGGILAYISLHKKNLLTKKKLHMNLQAVFGILLLVLANVYIDRDTTFPGAWALPPTMGAFFLIASQKSFINQYILSNRLLVYIGLISYPLYLWHWSLFSFAHILDYTSNESMFWLIFSSFLFAILTYEFIEKTLKKYKSSHVIYIIFFLSLILVFIGLSAMEGKFLPRNNTPIIKLVAEAHGDWDYPKGLKKEAINGETVYVKNGSEKKVIFYGDSHIQQYSPRIIHLFNQAPSHIKTVIFATRPGCPPIPNVYQGSRRPCSKKFKETIKKYALSASVDSIVIGASWASYLNKPENPGALKNRYYYSHNNKKIYFSDNGIAFALKSLEDFISSLSKSKKVFLLIDNPVGKEYDPNSLISGSRLTGLHANKNNVHEYTLKEAEIRNKLLELAKRSNAIIIDPIEHFCINNKCRTALDNGTPIYKDSNHIRPFYVEKFIDYIDISVKN